MRIVGTSAMSGITVTLLCLVACIVTSRPVAAKVEFFIDATEPGHRISPYIYGSNLHSLGPEENVTVQRYGGNRLTGYNWETNASNAGADWYHSSDGYLSSSLEPGKALTDFHDESLANGVPYTILTLQAAGYVSADRRGTVSESEVAPSGRWRTVQSRKGAQFELDPDTRDNYVYMDECVNFLVAKYGDASTPTGVKGYSIDNEPALWPHTHPRIHPEKTTCEEIVQKTVELASAVKDVDPHAEIYGPALYGYGAFDTFQDAPDWNRVRLGKGYGWFIDYYLDEMRKASESAGRRLLDVLDLHWYPEARGDSRIVFEQDATSERTIAARMQAPRSLWDPTYVEDSWISQWKSPSRTIEGVGRTECGAIALLPRVLASINWYYPGTKLAITEFNYGAEDHISGGIAMADALGIFGKYGVYAATYWPLTTKIGYVKAAYRIYRNYDGNKSTFGEVSLAATTSDIERTSVYASLSEAAEDASGDGLNHDRRSDVERSEGERSDGWPSDYGPSDCRRSTGVSSDGERSDGGQGHGERSEGGRNDGGSIHIIAINKDMTDAVDSSFVVSSGREIAHIEVWGFDWSSPEIKSLPSPTVIDGGAFTYTLPAMSVCHFVVSLR